MQIQFLGGAYTGRSSNVSSQQCVNYFYEKGVDSEALISTPGDTVFNSAYGGEVRGGINYNDLAYFVIGDKLVEFDSSGTGVSRGTLLTSNGRVGMAHNGVRTGATQEIMIGDGDQYYIYDNTTSTLTRYATAVGVPHFFDGYFFFASPGTDRIYNTNSYDGTTITGTDFVTAEGDPDELTAIIVEQRQVFALGKITLSAWYNSGDADTILARFQGGYSQTGCVAEFSPARFDNSIIWLSQNERGNAQVVRLGSNLQPQIVSSPEINYQLSTYSKVTDAFAYVYQEEGHEFYVLTFPTDRKTWVFDASTEQWHERAHIIDGEVSRERYNCHVFAFGKHLMGDYANGKIYALDSTSGTANGARMPRIRVTGNHSNQEKRVALASVQLDMEEGVGDPNEDDTSIWLSYSKDGGHTFSSERGHSIGDKGDYALRVIWRRLGRARNWVFKIRTWSPNRIVLKGLIAREHGEPL